jgi:thimet oligopeptidase
LAASIVLPVSPAEFWKMPASLEEWQRSVAEAMAQARALHAELVAVEGDRTVENTLVRYDNIVFHIGSIGGVAGTISGAHPEESWRAAARKVSQDLSAFGSEFSLDRRVYDALGSLKDIPMDAKWYVQHSLDSFRHAGVLQPENVRKQIAATRAELIKTEQLYAQNLAKNRRMLKLKVSELDTLPADFLKSHPVAEDGTIEVTNDATEIGVITRFAASPEVRQRAALHMANRGAPENEKVVRDLIRLRHKLATLCGFPNYAAQSAAGRMIATVENHRKFLHDLDRATAGAAERELAELLAAKKKDLPTSTSVEYFDTTYYSRLVAEARFQFDSRKAREYFPYSVVKNAVLRTAQDLFSLEFKQATAVRAWHPSVEVYDVFDQGRLIGRFYLDMHPREGKYQHFRSGALQTGVAGKRLPENVLLCNFPDPSKGPALLAPADAQTFFHEFGHLLHGIFAGKQRWAGTTRPESDFMEAPSQLLEEWLRNPEMLAGFTRHYQTGEPMPLELARSMIQAAEFGKGIGARRSLWLASAFLDMNDDGEPLADPGAVFGQHAKRLGLPHLDGAAWEQTVPHIGSAGYAAAYYTYAWSEVIAKDLFTRFDENNLMERGVARQYREKILERGGIKPAAELIADFLGRPFNLKAYEQWLTE